MVFDNTSFATNPNLCLPRHIVSPSLVNRVAYQVFDKMSLWNFYYQLLVLIPYDEYFEIIKQLGINVLHFCECWGEFGCTWVLISHVLNSTTPISLLIVHASDLILLYVKKISISRKKTKTGSKTGLITPSSSTITQLLKFSKKDQGKVWENQEPFHWT